MISVKALLQQYAGYNLWANERLSETILSLPEAQHQQTQPGSFSSLHATVLHMLDASSIWWQRLKMQDNITRQSENFKGNTTELFFALLHQDTVWKSWVEQASPAALEHVFHYQNSKKEQFRQPTFEMLLHVFNHATYHRGQLVTMLRNLGVKVIPATDFIVYARTRR